MKKFYFAKSTAWLFTFVFLMFGANAVFAAPPAPNLSVLPWQGPTTAMVNTPYQYKVRVKNIGNQMAQSVRVVVDLPLTDTSPTRHILGKITGIQTGCSIVSRKLQCDLGNLSQNQTKFFTFNFELPVSSKTLTFKATASTTSTNEVDGNNNWLDYTPAINYPTNQITSANVLVSLCTGTTLTSHFECELFPSSIQTFTMRLEQGGTITNLPDQSYTGSWDQNQTTQTAFQQLHFTISDGFNGAEFNGFASGSNCFEGITNFIPTSNYLSPYKVCIQ